MRQCFGTFNREFTMRILYFFTILFSLTAYGQGDLSGALRSQNQLQRLNFGNLEVPNNQATKTGAINALIETGNSNLLINSGFEHATYSTGWTTSGTATYSAETSVPLSGLKSFRAVASAQTIDLLQDTTLYASARAGSQMFISFEAKNTAPGVTACVRLNGVKQTGSNDCLTLATDGVTRTYELAFLANGTSNGIDIDAASTTGTLIVDEVKVSTDSAAFIDVAQIGPWISYTPTFQGFGTPTGIEAFYRINGGNIDVRIKFAAGTTTAVEARVGLPGGFTSATSTIIPTIQIAGNMSSNENSSALQFFPAIEPSAPYLVFTRRISGATGGLTKINGDSTLTSGNTLSLFASVPVQGLSNKVSTYSQFAVSDVSVENVFSASVSNTGVVSSESLDWINGNASVASTSNFTITFNSGAFSVAPNCIAGSSEAIVGTFDKIMTILSVSATQVVVQTKSANTGAAAWPFNIICTKQGADYKAKNVITGTFKDVVTAPNTGSIKTCYYAFGGAGVTLASPVNCTASPCVETYDSCGSVSSVTRSGTGVYVSTFASGTWQANTYVKCECQAYGTGSVVRRCYPSSTSSQTWQTDSSGGAVFSWATYDIGGSATDTYVSVECKAAP